MTYDDFLFYLPGYASVPIILAGGLAIWLAWRLFRSRKALSQTEKPKEPEVSKKT